MILMQPPLIFTPYNVHKYANAKEHVSSLIEKLEQD